MKLKIILGIGLALILGTLVFFGLRKEDQNTKGLVIYGNVDIRQVDLGFRVFGKVVKLFFDEGDYVKGGTLLALLDKVPYQEELEQSQAKVKEAEAALKNASAKFKKREVVSPGAISKEDYDNALYNQETMQATLELAKAALANALTNLQDTELYCPNNGTILTRIREPGSVLNAGEPVFTLSLEAPVWIRTYVTEPNLGRIAFDMKAEVTIDTKPPRVYHGHIGFISPVAEFTPKNVETTDLRTDLVYRLRVIVDDSDSELKQGMPVTVKVLTQEMPH